ncbi:MAG TPA: hypothetical protein VFV65_08755 [Gemmatimonadales bacterium]|nr:hypothetical protein [Gemmatimonadales bacterium]
MRIRRRGRAGLAAVIVMVGCSVPSESLGPGNHVTVTNLVGHFQLTADNIQNVTTTLTFTWQNPGTVAEIDHQSFMPHGSTLLIIRDAADSLRYEGKLLYQLEDRTAAGVPGEWTVTFSLDESVGDIDVTLEGLTPVD